MGTHTTLLEISCCGSHYLDSAASDDEKMYSIYTKLKSYKLNKTIALHDLSIHNVYVNYNPSS